VTDPFDTVRDERERQDEKWGEQNHDDMTWSAILGEEFGEACQAALEGNPAWGRDDDESLRKLRHELVQVAAVAMAWVEALDRRAV
jgi:hypothetical protein